MESRQILGSEFLPGTLQHQAPREAGGASFGSKPRRGPSSFSKVLERWRCGRARSLPQLLLLLPLLLPLLLLLRLLENAHDILLDVGLFRACLNDQRKFCADVRYGDARVKDCLESHRLDDDFSPRCKTEFDKMMERRATNFYLDSSLRKYCKADAEEFCLPPEVGDRDAKVIQCLQDYRDELKDSRCRDQVHKLTARAAEDFRFDKLFADACSSDRQKLCKDVPDGMARVFLCLQEHQSELKDICQSVLFDMSDRFGEDVDFKLPIKQGCTKELSRFCIHVPQGEGARLQCLQEKIDDPEMGVDCKKELYRDLKRTAEDYRLNWRLKKACFRDVQNLCAHSCDKELEAGSLTCGGTVIRCLQDNDGKIESDECEKELFHFNKLQARDPLEFDVPLQRACAASIMALCKGGSKGHALTLSCLRQHRAELGQECADEEKRLSIMEASDIRLTPTLKKACGQELQGFCRDVPPQGGAAFKCLQQNRQDMHMGAACKGEVNLQELRHASNHRRFWGTGQEAAHAGEGVDRDKLEETLKKLLQATTGAAAAAG